MPNTEGGADAIMVEGNTSATEDQGESPFWQTKTRSSVNPSSPHKRLRNRQGTRSRSSLTPQGEGLKCPRHPRLLQSGLLRDGQTK